MELQGWEHFEHRADIGIRGFGGSPAEAFEQCALAMMAIITDLSLIDARDVIKISCEEPDPELGFDTVRRCPSNRTAAPYPVESSRVDLC